MKLQILDKYLFFRILSSSILSVLSLLAIFVFFKFLEELEHVGTESYSLITAIQYITFLIPGILNSVAILGVMIGTILSIGAMNQNRELLIYSATSISLKDIILKILKFSFLIAFAMVFLSELITPNSLKYANNIRDIALKKNFTKGNSGLWIKDDTKYIFLERNPSKSKINNLYVFKFDDERTLEFFLKGDDIEIKNNFIVPNKINGLNFSKIDDRVMIEKIKNKKEIFQVNLSEDQINFLTNQGNYLSIDDLLKKIIYSGLSDTRNDEYVVELINRLIKPITLVGMILVAIPFIIKFDRGSSIGNRIFMSTAIGVLTYLVTKIFSIISVTFQGFSILGPLSPTLILLFIGLLFIAKIIKS